MKATLIILLLFTLANYSLAGESQWVEQVSGTTQTLTSVYSVSAGFAWACGYGGTVLKTTNYGVTWTNFSGNGIPATAQLISISSAGSGNYALAAGYIGSNTFLYRTENGGQNWTQVFSETNGFLDAVYVDVTDPTKGFMMGDPVNGRWSLWKTSNSGITWDSTGLYLPQIGADAGWVNSLYSRNGNIWFGTNNTRLYYSSNSGSSWAARPTIGEVNSYSVWFSGLGGIGYTGFVGGATLLKTENSGLNWTSQTPAGAGNFGGISGGPNILTESSAGTLIYLYVRSDSKIYSTQNNGSNWTAEYTAPAGIYRYVASDYNGTHFWAVRDNGGISYLDRPIGITTISSEVPEKFSLSQNYPNPFNPNTKINYELRIANYVTLKVFDVLGNEVRTLVSEKQNAGSYSVDFEASGLSSGIYFYTLKTDGFSETKRMTLLK